MRDNTFLIGNDAYFYSIPPYAYDEKPLLKSFELFLPQNKWTSILGPSGCGKTTLLRLIAGLIPHYRFPSDLRIAYLPQSELLFPWASALNNVMIGPKLRGTYNDSYPKALQIFQKMGLSDYIHYLPGQLSGGMKQRVQLARILLEDADIILMDEPFSQLDALTSAEMNHFAKFYLHDKTVLLVTHDPLEALRLSDQIYILDAKPSSIREEIILNDTMRKDPGLLHNLFEKLGIAS